MPQTPLFFPNFVYPLSLCTPHLPPTHRVFTSFHTRTSPRRPSFLVFLVSVLQSLPPIIILRPHSTPEKPAPTPGPPHITWEKSWVCIHLGSHTMSSIEAPQGSCPSSPVLVFFIPTFSGELSTLQKCVRY